MPVHSHHQDQPQGTGLCVRFVPGRSYFNLPFYGAPRAATTFDMAPRSGTPRQTDQKRTSWKIWAFWASLLARSQRKASGCATRNCCDKTPSTRPSELSGTSPVTLCFSVLRCLEKLRATNDHAAHACKASQESRAWMSSQLQAERASHGGAAALSSRTADELALINDLSRPIAAGKTAHFQAVNGRGV